MYKNWCYHPHLHTRYLCLPFTPTHTVYTPQGMHASHSLTRCHAHHPCTWYIHTTPVHDVYTPSLYIVYIHHSCTWRTYATPVHGVRTPLLYMAYVRHSCTWRTYATPVHGIRTPLLYMAYVRHSCTWCTYTLCITARSILPDSGEERSPLQQTLVGVMTECIRL